MDYKLIKPVNKNYSALEQVLTNRGIKYEDIDHYINTTDEDINSFLLLGEDKLRKAISFLLDAIKNNKKTVIIQDADCDGYCSSALLINYLYDLFPAFVDNCVEYIIHEGKQHGLSDCYEEIIKNKYSLVFEPDAGSNDGEYHKILSNNNIKVIVLDHHECEGKPEECDDTVIINNQYGEYPNKHFCGVGVVWQFCRYIDSLLNTNYADDYLDLVALGNTADMMSLLSFETKHIINKGFKTENVKNPFIYYMWGKNKFKLGDELTSWGVAFYIAPFVNAMVRSGENEEKELLFKSMLKKEAFKNIPSTKRGHKEGEEEKLVEQAIRVCTNVKNRQTKSQDLGMDYLESMIEEYNLLNNKVLLFLLKPGEVDKKILGLIANKYMAKYQRPCCILTRVEEDGNISYQGSARGCDKVGVTNFKDICESTGYTMYVAGHQGAFGLGIEKQYVQNFIDKTNLLLKDMSDKPIYFVDYIYNQNNINKDNILDIADMDSYWGKDLDTSIIAIEGLKVTKDMITLMSPDKSPTLKIKISNEISLIKFGSSQEEYDKLYTEGYIELNIVGRCNKNEWNGNISAQILIDDYEIIDSAKYFF